MHRSLIVYASFFLSLAYACTTIDDCHGAGLCNNGVCQCDAGFTGDKCERLNVGKSYKCHSGGLCMHGETSNVVKANNSWGGSVSYNEKDGKWHMFSAIMKDYGFLDEWLLGSEVGHAVSDTPQGPYIPKDIALGSIKNSTLWDSTTQHNPAISRAPDGTWLLFYMGSYGDHSGTMQECQKRPTKASLCNQQIGLATAKDPSGPWKRSTTPLLSPRGAHDWDNVFVTNPSAYTLSNGTTVLIYKGRNSTFPSNMYTGVAIADSYEGPYRRFDAPFAVPPRCEDASIFFSNFTQTFHALFHCDCNYQVLWSYDALDWKSGGDQLDWCNVNYTDGTSGHVQERQRPFVIHDEHGKISHLSTSCLDKTGPHWGLTWTMVSSL